jgi:cytochrome c2
MKRILTNCLLPAMLLLAMGCSKSQSVPNYVGNPELGKSLIQDYGCVACHVIPGVPQPGSNVGPPLVKIGDRAYIGGVLTNTPENMVRWLMDPPAVDPLTVMPDLGISEEEAKHIAAYLYTLR